MSVPYPLELNDIPAMVSRQQSAHDFEDMIRDQFDEMLRRSEKYPLVFTVSLHPFVIGQPFRMHVLRRALDYVLQKRDRLWIAVPGEIARVLRRPASGHAAGLLTRLGLRTRPRGQVPPPTDRRCRRKL